jgi:alpha-beta hydrolase superfamily lysophospholipase
MRLSVLAAASLLAVSAVLGLGASRASGHSCVKANELWFRAADGTRLVGHRFGGKRPGSRTAVVLAHQSNGSLCEWEPYARRLAARGLFAFPFDLRGHGESKGRQDFGRLGLDVAGAVRAVRSLGARRVVVVGASLGGIAGVVGAANARPPVSGLVAVSAPAEIAGRLNALPAAARLAVPTLYLAAEGDQSPPYDFAADAQRLYDATGTSEKRVEVEPGSLHGVALVAGSARVRALVEAFLRDPAGTVG